MRINFNMAPRGAIVKLSYAMGLNFPILFRLVLLLCELKTIINRFAIASDTYFSRVVTNVIVFPSNLTLRQVTSFVSNDNQWIFKERAQEGEEKLFPACLLKGWWFEINVMRLDVMRFPKREIKNDWTRFTDFSSPSTSIPTLSWFLELPLLF